MINSKAQGFTLIETLVAVLLLSVAIAGPLTIASRGLTGAITARDQMGAFYLAQDAVEYVRFARDTNKLSGGNWLTGAGGGAAIINLSPCVSSDGSVSCKIDTVQSTVASCSGMCPEILYDSTNHYFSYSTGAQTTQHYIRTVTITTPVGGQSVEAKVTVTVSWYSAGHVAHQVTVDENLFDWQ